MSGGNRKPIDWERIILALLSTIGLIWGTFERSGRVTAEADRGECQSHVYQKEGPDSTYWK